LLRSLSASEPYVEIAPADAAERGIAANEWVVVVSMRGAMRARAFVTSTVRPGTVFVPMHFATTNQLTQSEVDPYSRQPSYKWCPVQVRRHEPWDP
jgi:assimilatory nitrate reductase catalytic subunit